VGQRVRQKWLCQELFDDFSGFDSGQLYIEALHFVGEPFVFADKASTDILPHSGETEESANGRIFERIWDGVI
jgi:hypothetical protein